MSAAPQGQEAGHRAISSSPWPNKSVERLADNALIARKFRALGFSKVRVSGAGAVRRVEGVWHRKDASATLPRQIVAVARL
jgi:hypothetical protein